MHVTLVHVRVKPGSIAEFVEACRLNHLGATEEPGNRRFDVLQDAEDETHFVLYEAYFDEASAMAHKQTPHYLAWREQVAEMMAEPRQGKPFLGLFPAE